KRRVVVEAIGLVEIRHVLAGLAERRHFEIAVDPEGLPHRYLNIRLAGRSRSGCRLLNGWHASGAFWFWDGKIGPRSLGGSVEIAGLEGRIGLIDDLQLLLGGLVAAMGVRVVLLDQRLITRLEAQRGKRRFEIEHREGLFASRDGARGGIPGVTAMTIGPMTIRMTVGAAPVLLAGIKTERIADLRPRSVALAELPGRPLPNGVTPDLRLDLGFAHPRIIIPRDVVGTYMFKAEPVIGVE